MKGARTGFLLLILLCSLTSSLILHAPSKLIFTTPIAVASNTQSTEVNFLASPLVNFAPMTNGNSPRNWTVLVYMAADNNEEIAAVQNLNEMEIVGSTHQVNILVYVDFLTNYTGYGPGALTLNITKDDPPTNSTISSMPVNTPLPLEPNMGDPATLLAFIQFAQNYSQADHYMLILWGKGTGYTGVCDDQTSGGDRLRPQEIAWVLENDTIEPIDITAFDASLMGQLELAFEIQNGTDYIIYSEENVPMQHFPYHIILNSLTIHEDSSPILLAKEVVDRYIEAYSAGGTYYLDFTRPPTALSLSVINTSQIADVFLWFNQTINWFNTSYNTYHYYSQISTARGLTQQFSIPHYIDLLGFTQQLFQQIPNPSFRNYAGNLSESIQEAVSYQRHLSGIPGASGFGINFDYYLPIPLSLLTMTAYTSFLSTFLTIGETNSTSYTTFSLSSITGYLDGEADSVYYRFTPEIAAEHTITLTSFQTVDEDFDLYLYDENLNLLARSIELSSHEAVQWALVPGEIYYLQIYSNPRQDITYGLGSFEIVISPGPPVNPVAMVVQIGIIVTIGCVILLIGYIIWRKRESIRRQIQRYRIRRMARRLREEATADEESASPAVATCEKCGEQLPEDARYCPICGETFTGPADEPKV